MGIFFNVLLGIWLLIFILIISTQKEAYLWFYSVIALFVGGVIFLGIMPICYFIKNWKKYKQTGVKSPLFFWAFLFVLFLIFFIWFPLAY